MDPNKVPLYHDNRLAAGWHRKVSQRKSGMSAGRYEVFIIGPTGKRFRSRNELKAFIEKTGDKSVDPYDFDFSICGSSNITSGRAPPAPPGIPPDASTITPTRSSKAKTASVSPRVHLPDVVPTTSPGLTSPNANKVLGQMSGGNVTIQHIQQPVAPQPKFPSSPAAVPSSNDLVQQLQDPLPPTSIASTPQLPQHPPSYQSQLSMETAEADQQISSLLESWQKHPQKVVVENDKMAEILSSLSSGDGELDPATGTVTSAEANAALGLGTHQQPRPVTLKPVEPPASTAPEMTSGTTGFQASFLNSLASNPDPGIAPEVAANQGVAVGGSPSQMRALSQNVAQNTRLVRGPNGQYSLQKVQTIELTPDMQSVS